MNGLILPRNVKRGKHINVSSCSKKLFKRLDKCDAISKIVLGAAQNCRHSYPESFVKFVKFNNSGFELKLYTKAGVRAIFIYCTQKNIEIARNAVGV